MLSQAAEHVRRISVAWNEKAQVVCFSRSFDVQAMTWHQSLSVLVLLLLVCIQLLASQCKDDHDVLAMVLRGETEKQKSVTETSVFLDRYGTQVRRQCADRTMRVRCTFALDVLFRVCSERRTTEPMFLDAGLFVG